MDQPGQERNGISATRKVFSPAEAGLGVVNLENTLVNLEKCHVNLGKPAVNVNECVVNLEKCVVKMDETVVNDEYTDVEVRFAVVNVPSTMPQHLGALALLVRDYD